MSVLIDMEMPKERESFTVTIKYNGLVFDTETGIQVAEAHEVLPHGRLIDADEIKTAFPCGESVRTECVRATIDNAPTVVEAEPSEERREYEAQVEAAQYCEMYEPSYDPETGAL